MFKKIVLRSVLCLLSSSLCAMEGDISHKSANYSADADLIGASKRGETDKVTQLLNEQEFSNITLHNALSRALNQNDFKTAQVLVDYDAPLGFQEDTVFQSTVFKWLGIKGNSEAFDHAVKEYPQAQEFPALQQIALNWAAGSGQTPFVKHVLEEHALDINWQDAQGKTALTWAIGNGHKETVKELLSHGASAAIEDNDGQTVLHWVASEGCPGISEAPSARSESIPKGYSTDNEKHRVFSEILDMILHCDPNLLAKNKLDGFLPLHSAIIGGNIKTIETLIALAKKKKLLPP